MKYIIVVLPGAADHPAEELGGKTPLEVSKIPNLNHFTKIGRLGSVKLVSERYDLLADTSFLNLLGYEADKVYTGRGPLEAANLELKLEENEIPFRMNFITESGGTLADATAGCISIKEARALINFLNKKLASDFVRFFPGNEYRHVAVIKDSHGFEALSAKTTPPKAMVGEKLDAYFPKGPGEELLRKLMYDAKLLLQDHEINQVRIDLKENPANMIWLWGQGQKPDIEKFSDRFHVSGALIATTEYIKGIGRLAGLTVMELVDRPGDMEANHEKRGKMLLEALEDKDLVCCHVSACDEAAAQGDMKTKISGLESVDFFVLSKVRGYLEKHKNTRVLITPLHATPWKMKRHVRDAVPFTVAGKGLMPDEIEKFSELAAKSSEFKMNKATDLMPFFLHGK